jgi:hypothetical protein
VVSSAQPGFPPDDPDSWRVAGTAKVLGRRRKAER